MSVLLQSIMMGASVGLLPFMIYGMLNGGIQQPLYINIPLITVGVLFAIPVVPSGAIIGFCIGVPLQLCDSLYRCGKLCVSFLKKKK